MLASTIVAADTSVLINFVHVDRLDLLFASGSRVYGVPDHVNAEMAVDFPAQRARIEKGYASGLIHLPMQTEDELACFGDLLGRGVLGEGECDAIAIAVCRRLTVATDDRKARRVATEIGKGIEIIGSADIVREAIRERRLSVAEADMIKERWESEFRFRLSFDSFAD